MIQEKISHYRIIKLLGTGGLGEVYLAKDTTFGGHLVALKLLPKELTKSGRLERFFQEAKAASALSHPNIATIYDVGEDEQHGFIVREFVEGETLGRKLVKGPLELREAVDIAVQVAGALEAAHLLRVIHRDIKPENIMITPAGQAKVIDFGLARVLRDAERLHDPGTVVGTLLYMSPEQAKGESADPRSDIFSFGVVLYEMLTGKLPFAAEDFAATLEAILTREPPPLAKYCPEAPSELQWIVTKALAKEPEERYQCTADLAIDLRHVRNLLVENTEGKVKRMADGKEKASTITEEQRGALWPPIVRDILQGVTVAGVLAVGIWVGSIRTTVDQNKERLQEISKAVLDTKEGVSVRTAVLEEKLKGIDEKITALANQLKTVRGTIGPRAFGKDQLNARIDGVGWLLQADPDLSETLAKLDVLSNSISEIRRAVPESYGQNLRNRLNSLEQRIEELRRLAKV